MKGFYNSSLYQKVFNDDQDRLNRIKSLGAIEKIII